MRKLKVIEVKSDSLLFNDGTRLSSYHESDCCEQHWLDMSNLSLEDFEDLEFDLTNDEFLEKIKEYGVALKPIKGFPVRIPGYGSNNGYYSTNLTLTLSNNEGFNREYDISECQDISD